MSSYSFHPFPSDKKASKVLMNVFFSRHHYNFHSIPFFVYAFYNYDSKARYLAQRQTNNCNCCQRAHTASFRCCRKMLLLIWFCGSNMQTMFFFFSFTSLFKYQSTVDRKFHALIIVSSKSSSIKIYASINTFVNKCTLP